ncbi:MAG: hypothetical protein IT329_14150 [Caldilineaceae bacterium]|nr:hypothetical protein [Caldilineaceae bacterium]
MRNPMVSNAFLSLGTLMLVGFGALEVSGFHSDPLLPAFAAFLIGVTAVLDRVGTQQL